MSKSKEQILGNMNVLDATEYKEKRKREKTGELPLSGEVESVPLLRVSSIDQKKV